MEIVDTFNLKLKDLAKLPVKTLINLQNSKTFHRKEPVILFKLFEPLSNVEITFQSSKKLAFGKAYSLFTEDLQFAYMFTFPICTVENGPGYIAAIRRQRESFSDIQVSLVHEVPKSPLSTREDSSCLCVLGSSDATLVLYRAKYSYLPDFNLI